MRLIDRMQTAEAESGNGERTAAAAAPAESHGDPLADFKDEARKALYAKLDEQRLDGVVNDLELRRAVAAELGRFMSEEKAPLSPSERERVISEISEDILGHGPIERMLADDSITEVMVNSTQPIYIERAGRIERTAVRFRTEDHLRQVIDRIVSRVGRRVDESSPMVDARLPDGSRVNAVIPPLAVDGPALTIRKFAKDPFQIEHLIEFGTLSVGMASLLKLCVEGRLNVLITGGTGTGKTTLLNVVSGFIPSSQRIVTIEDSVELQLHQDHVIRLENGLAVPDRRDRDPQRVRLLDHLGHGVPARPRLDRRQQRIPGAAQDAAKYDQVWVKRIHQRRHANSQIAPDACQRLMRH
jgi:pilus assembly protein CpaF